MKYLIKNIDIFKELILNNKIFKNDELLIKDCNLLENKYFYKIKIIINNNFIKLDIFDFIPKEHFLDIYKTITNYGYFPEHMNAYFSLNDQNFLYDGKFNFDILVDNILDMSNMTLIFKQFINEIQIQKVYGLNTNNIFYKNIEDIKLFHKNFYEITNYENKYTFYQDINFNHKVYTNDIINEKDIKFIMLL